MPTRYEDATEVHDGLLREIRTNHFPELRNAKIKVIFDLKKRKAKGQIVLAKITKANDLIRHLTDNNIDPGGYDYIISLDKACWDSVEQKDRERILRHELRHTYFDIDSENDPYKIIDHDVTDFYEEITRNTDDPRWRERCVAVADSVYEQRKEEATALKGKKGRK